MNNTNRKNQAESGNALFLILIAVVLFAALSYAITQSNRGGGAPNRETSMISSTTITQYSSAVRTGITRMTLRNIDIADLDFTAPTDTADYATQVALGPSATQNMVFHPDGGGVSYSSVDQATVNTVVATLTNRQNQNWHYRDANVAGVGTTASDLVAFLEDIRKPLCESINQQITGNKTIPVIAAAVTAIVDGSTPLTGTGIDGQAFKCIKSNTVYIYYQVMAEN